MSASGEHNVGIRDRRELPFFQVRVGAVRAIRQATSGPRRLRAIGFYALLCQLANEQRHTGEHRVVEAGYEELARRARASKSTVKTLLDTLTQAGVVRYERLNDPHRGAAVSLLHLLVQDGAWTAITVAMADHLALPPDGAHALRNLGLIVVLLELCAEQRTERGGLVAEATRSEIATRAGVTVDHLDECNRVLERALVLSVERRRAGTGGRHLASTYTIHEAPGMQDSGPAPSGAWIDAGGAGDEYRQGGHSVLAGRALGTNRAGCEYLQGGPAVPAGRATGTGRAGSGYWQGGNPATVGTESPPSNARAREQAVENDVETTPPASTVDERGEGIALASARELCEALLAAWEPALGDSPRRRYEAEETRWLAAATELLARHARARLQHALDYMLGDEILGSRALTLPDFAAVADQLLARHHARQRRSSAVPAAAAMAEGGLGWPEARGLLEQAVRRHGRDNRTAALSELAAHSELLVQFVQRVRWSTLCEQAMTYAEGRYAQLWAELQHHATAQRREVAA